MMNKKATNYILILGVIVIWVFVIKKSSSVLQTDSSKEISVPIVENRIDFSLEFKKDTFNLYELSRDPFLDNYKKNRTNLVVKTKKSSSIKTNKTISKKKEKSNLTWPKLKYFGFMKGGSSLGELALIKINNKLHRVRSKEEIEGIIVYSVFSDSVVLKKNKEYKTIHK